MRDQIKNLIRDGHLKEYTNNIIMNLRRAVEEEMQDTQWIKRQIKGIQVFPMKFKQYQEGNRVETQVGLEGNMQGKPKMFLWDFR